MGKESTDVEVAVYPYAVVRYDPERYIGKVIWTGNPNPDEYKVPFMTILEWAHKGNKVTRFMSDTRDQGVVSPENRKWFEKEMVPAAMAAGCTRATAITGGNVFKKYYLNMLLSAINKFGMPFKISSSEEEAVAFLMEG